MSFHKNTRHLINKKEKFVTELKMFQTRTTAVTNKTIEILLNLCINETCLSFSNETEFLGITIDNKLSFSNHVSK